MEMELEQVRLAIDTDPQVMKILKKRNMLRTDGEGEYVPVVFNSAEIRFRPRSSVLVGRTVANAIMRSNTVILGEDIDGQITPFLRALESVNLATPEPEAKFPCEFCGESFNTARDITRHILKQHEKELGEGDATPNEPALREPKAVPATKEPFAYKSTR